MGDKTWTISLRQLYLQAQPVKGIEGTWGGMAIARGEHTEISTTTTSSWPAASA